MNCMMHPTISKMKPIAQVLAVVAMIIVVSNATKIKKCKGEGAPSIDDIKVQLGDCKSERCVLKRGKTYSFEQYFKAPVDANSTRSVTIGMKYGYALPLSSGSDPDACQSIKNSNGEPGCPLQEGKSYVYNKPVEIRKTESKIEADIQWHLVDEKDESLTCFEIAVKIEE